MKRKKFEAQEKKPIYIKIYFQKPLCSVQRSRRYENETMNLQKDDYLCWNETWLLQKLIYRQQWQKVNILRAKFISCKFILHCSLSPILELTRQRARRSLTALQSYKPSLWQNSTKSTHDLCVSSSRRRRWTSFA